MRIFFPARAALGLAAATASAAIAANAADGIPTGRLSDDAIPRHYTLRFEVDPRGDRFSGETHIRVDLARPADHVFLHAQNIDIAKSTVTANGETREATAIAHREAGVLDVRFGRTIAAGDIELAFEYSASFNGKLEGLYKVKVGGDAYAITQMEPIRLKSGSRSVSTARRSTALPHCSGARGWIARAVPRASVLARRGRDMAPRAIADAPWITTPAGSIGPPLVPDSLRGRGRASGGTA